MIKKQQSSLAANENICSEDRKISPHSHTKLAKITSDISNWSRMSQKSMTYGCQKSLLSLKKSENCGYIGGVGMGVSYQGSLANIGKEWKAVTTVANKK